MKQRSLAITGVSVVFVQRFYNLRFPESYQTLGHVFSFLSYIIVKAWTGRVI